MNKEKEYNDNHGSIIIKTKRLVAGALVGLTIYVAGPPIYDHFKPTKQELLEEVYKIADLNKDGTVDQNETRKFLSDYLYKKITYVSKNGSININGTKDEEATFWGLDRRFFSITGLEQYIEEHEEK